MQTETKISLYERDFALWIEDVTAKLKARDFDNLDIDNVLEEIEALGKSQRREVKSRLQTLLAHILKRMYVDSPLNYNGWERTIREQCKELKLLFEQSPSLKGYYTEVFENVWQSSLSEVQQEYKKTEFPEVWQFSSDVDSVLNENFWEEI
ncbi:DUF29 domain-containing protein [Argonema antarcticum]|uniref:DUF29 domain-containing protein n=1 Tax=Argonema antarcticum TaxID=2942763 RepID=UPI0020135E84|nr:DUF29 domain-containing protein [Argonema antarcticum]MCL1473247.1 DUF29 domain-containing protein [Argonema antarcticum A004/B2]